MMPSRLIVFGASLLVLAGATGAWTAFHQLKGAREEYHASVENLEQTKRDEAEVVRLRGEHEVVAWQPRPTSDVLAQVNAALIEAGIPTAQLKGISEGSDTPLPHRDSVQPKLRRQSLTITIESLTLSQVGSFFSAWNTSQSTWRSPRLELVHRREERNADLYDLRLDVDAIYITQG